VVISGAPGARERLSGLLLHHQVRTVDSQAAIYREITCDQAFLTDPMTAPAEINRVLRSALERSLPVYIEMPRDMVAAEVTPVPRLPRSPVDPEAFAECADEIAIRMKSAARPVIVVDVEVRRYGIEDAVAELARRLGAPVVTTFMGRGLLAHHGDIVAGTYMGGAGDPAVTTLVEEADAALLLGVILSDTNFALSRRRLDPRRTILAIDRSVTIGHHAYAAIPLDAIVEAVAVRAPARAQGTRKRASAPQYRHGLPRDGEPIAPSDIACAINDLFAAHGAMMIASDIGDCLFTAMEIENTALVAPGYYSGMGFGVPAGIGLAASGTRRRRRRLPDDRVRARQLPALRPRSDRGPVQQCKLGDAARVPAGIPLQRSQRLAFRRHGGAARRPRCARHHPGRTRRGARARRQAPWRILHRRGHAAARRDLGHAGELRARLQGSARQAGNVG